MLRFIVFLTRKLRPSSSKLVRRNHCCKAVRIVSLSFLLSDYNISAEILLAVQHISLTLKTRRSDVFVSIDVFQLKQEWSYNCQTQTTNSTDEQITLAFRSLACHKTSKLPSVLVVCHLSVDETHWRKAEKLHLRMTWLFTL